MEKNIQTVTFLIGNGFDIGALSALKSEYLTTYSQSYKYLETHCLNKDNLNLVCELLKYAPEIFLDELKMTLKNYKDLTLKFTK